MRRRVRFFERWRHVSQSPESHFRIDTTKKLPANAKGAFLLFEKVHDVYRSYDNFNEITFESMRNMTSSTKVARAFDLDAMQPVTIDDERFNVVLEIASKTLDDDKTVGRKYAVSMGNLISDQPITGRLKSTRVVIRVFVEMRQEVPTRVPVRFRFKYRIRGKVDPEHGKNDRNAPSAS